MASNPSVLDAVRAKGVTMCSSEGGAYKRQQSISTMEVRKGKDCYIYREGWE